MAPELLSGSRRYGPEVDLYSFGVLMFECIALRRPWVELNHDRRKITNLVTNGERPRVDDEDFVDEMFPDLLPLMQACWSANGHDRPTILEVSDRLYGMLDPESRSVRNLSSISSKTSVDEEENAVRRSDRESVHSLKSRSSSGTIAAGSVELTEVVSCELPQGH